MFSDDLYSDVQVFRTGRVAPCVTAAEQGVLVLVVILFKL